MIEKLEITHKDAGNGQRWDVSGWYGSQLNRLWLKSEGERSDNTTESTSLEAFASNGMPDRD